MARIYKRLDGRWCTAYTHGVNDNGTPKRKYIYGKIKKEIEEKLRLFANDVIEFGKAIDNTGVSLSEWAYKHLFINIPQYLLVHLNAMYIYMITISSLLALV